MNLLKIIKKREADLMAEYLKLYSEMPVEYHLIFKSLEDKGKDGSTKDT